MKIGIFIDNFFDAQKYKDPGVIAQSLFDLGHQVTIYCLNTNSETFSTIIVKKINRADSTNYLFWKEEKIDAVLMYSWLSLRFSKIIKAISVNNIKLILKLDSDGHLIYPLTPRYLIHGPRDNSLKSLFLYILRLIEWKIFPHIISRKKIEQIKIASALIIESSKAADNLSLSLNYYKENELVKKINIVPNPIVVKFENSVLEKKNTIISVGRWNDKQKNSKTLEKIIRKFNRHNWRFLLFGEGSSRIVNNIKKHNSDINIYSQDSIEHDEILKKMGESKILFAPSIYEGYSISASEAVCCGCSIAGTPLESFLCLTENEDFGSLSKDFSIKSIEESLYKEIERWEKGEHFPETILNVSRKKLDPKKIGKKIEEIITLL